MIPPTPIPPSVIPAINRYPSPDFEPEYISRNPLLVNIRRARRARYGKSLCSEVGLGLS